MVPAFDRNVIPWVLVPGTLCTDACFAPVLAALNARGIDPPISSFLPGKTANPVEDAMYLLREAPSRFVFCAFSLGGIIAFQAALAAPERIAAIILISVTGRADRGENTQIRRAQVEKARQDSAAALIRETLWPNYVATASLNNLGLRQQIEAMATKTDLQRFANQAEIAIVRPDVINALGHVQIPTLVINGEADVATPPEHGVEVAHALVDGQHTLIADASHFVLMEQAEATAGAIQTWMLSAGAALSH